MPGFVPYVTIGRSLDTSMCTSLSNFAPSSLGSLRQRSTASSQAAPFGASGRPAMYWYVVSSGAIMPARAPASIDMLQTVMRCFHRQRADRAAAILDDVTRCRRRRRSCR